jgi:hypothetical protein
MHSSSARMHAKYPACHINFDLMILIILGEECKSRNSLCSPLQPPDTSSLYGPNIVFSSAPSSQTPSVYVPLSETKFHTHADQKGTEHSVNSIYLSNLILLLFSQAIRSRSPRYYTTFSCYRCVGRMNESPQVYNRELSGVGRQVHTTHFPSVGRLP